MAATAEPLASLDALYHADYAYRPETGEEVFQSLMGVPVLRGGRVVGVWPSRIKPGAGMTTRTSMFGNRRHGSLGNGWFGELVSREELAPSDGIALLPLRLEGIGLNAGTGMGRVVASAAIRVERLVAEDTDSRKNRLKTAVSEMHGALDNMLESSHIAKD